MMTSYLIAFITTIISLLIGYVLGCSNESEEKVTTQKVGEFIKKVNPINKPKLGAVIRPTDEELKFQKKPWLKEEVEEVTKTFDRANEDE